MTMDHATNCDLLAAELDRAVAAVRAADPAAPVPSCPGWAVADVVEHLGAVHRWCELIVRTLTPTRIPSSSIEPGAPGPTDGAEAWADWLAEGAAPLLATLRSADPDAAVWAWGPDHHTRWWARRQLHETTVHRIDVELGAGVAWTVDPAVAVDGVDEFLANIPSSAYFSSGVGNLKGDGSIHLHATDAPGEWMVHLTPTGFEITHDHGKGTVAARGPAEALLAATYGREGAERLEVFGDADLLAWWFTNSALQ